MPSTGATPDPPKHVLMTADTVGGVWTYAVQFASTLTRLGATVTLATMGRECSALQRQEVEAIGNVQLLEGRYKLEWMDDCWDDVARAGEWLLDIERQARPDVVHLNGYVHAALPWHAPVLVVAHSCVLSWWEAVHGVPAPGEWTRYREAVRAGLLAADLVLAPSHAMLDAIRRHYGFHHAATVVPNAAGAGSIACTAKQPLVFAAGRLWDEAKNVLALDRVAPKVPWPVFVAGDTTGPGGGTVALQHAHALGALAPHDVHEWMSRAAVYALPARYEPFGLSVLEAARARCALVLGDIPSLRENWDGAARFVPPNDDGAIAEALRRLIDDPAERDTLGEAAAARAREFTPERQRDGYLRAYAELSQARRHRGDSRN